MIFKINETISYIGSNEEPLSAEVGVVRGKERIWFYDVGNGNAAGEEIRELLVPVASWGRGVSASSSPELPVRTCGVILSHFHPDHIGNLSCFPAGTEVYVGENTRKYTQRGLTVTQDLYLEDGCTLHLFPLPSTHAKGSLGLEVNGEYAFLGDGLYAAQKGDRVVYNAQLLREELRVLKSLKAHTFLISHGDPFCQGREETIRQLEEIYSRREKDQPYIQV